MDLKEYKKKEKQLEIVAKTLSKTKITYEELKILEKDHPGIIIKYWRIHWGKTYVKFMGSDGFLEMLLERSPEEDEEIEDKAVSEGTSTMDIDAMIAKIKEENP